METTDRIKILPDSLAVQQLIAKLEAFKPLENLEGYPSREESLARLEAAKHKGRDDFSSGIGVQYVQVYLRRFAAILNSLSVPEEQKRSTWALGNLAGLIIEFDADELVYIASLREHFRNNHRSASEARVMAHIVSWLATKSSALPFADPYEPLGEFFRLGGTFTTEHGFIDVNYNSAIDVEGYRSWLTR